MRGGPSQCWGPGEGRVELARAGRGLSGAHVSPPSSPTDPTAPWEFTLFLPYPVHTLPTVGVTPGSARSSWVLVATTRL